MVVTDIRNILTLRIYVLMSVLGRQRAASIVVAVATTIHSGVVMSDKKIDHRRNGNGRPSTVIRKQDGVTVVHAQDQKPPRPEHIEQQRRHGSS